MAFLGTIVNFVGVLIFGVLGSFVKKGIPKRITDALISAMAICVIFIGIDGVLESAPTISKIESFSNGLVKILIMIISMAIGTLVGELVNIDYNWGELNIYSRTSYDMEDTCMKACAEAPYSLDIEPDDIDATDTVTFVWQIV